MVKGGEKQIGEGVFEERGEVEGFEKSFVFFALMVIDKAEVVPHALYHGLNDLRKS